MNTTESHQYDAFISYSHHDEAWVQQWLLPKLEAAGVRVCIDFRDFQLGAPSIAEIERAVLQSSKTLLVLTPNYLASEWTTFENILAQTRDPAARQRRLLPLLLQPCQLPLRISALTYLDFTKPINTALQLTRLITAIQSENGLASSTVAGPVSAEQALQAATAPNSLTAEQRRRLERKRDTHQQEWNLRGEKVRRLRTAAAIEASTAIKFQLEQQLLEEQAALIHVERELDELERILH